MSKKIVLFTATGAENLGDELITLCEIRHLQSLYPDSCIVVFSHDIMRTKRFLQSQLPHVESIEIQEYFPNHLRKKPLKNVRLFWESLKALKNAERVYIGGGGLFYSRGEERHSPLRLWWMRALLIKMLRKPLIYLSLGITAKIGELRPFARGLFQGATITVRDEKSREIVSHLGYESALLPDPVLTYSPRIGEKGKIIGIALRRGFVQDQVIIDAIRQLISIGYEILLLPHSLHPCDTSSHDGYYLQNFLLPGVATTQTIEQTLAGYTRCHIIISMRLHSMILALDHHIPFIGISYGQKTSELLTDTDWRYSSKPDVSTEEILSSISEIESHYDELAEKLSEKHSQYQSRYKKIFQGL